MIRITRMTDYAIILLTFFARCEEGSVQTARELAAEASLPLPTVNKVLKTLTRQGLLQSHRGMKGGYSLARGAGEITVAEIIGATEGPVAMTECTVEGPVGCSQEPECPVSSAWHRINGAIQEALGRITLAEMSRPVPPRGDEGSIDLMQVQGLQPS